MVGRVAQLVAGWQMIQAHILTAALSASVAFGAGWQINDWRHDAHEKQAIEAAATAQRELHALEQARSRASLDAQNLARKRETVLRADAAAARDALAGLREQSALAVQGARASREACIVTTTTATELLNQCSKRYTDLGAAADRHVSDLRLQLDTP